MNCPIPFKYITGQVYSVNGTVLLNEEGDLNLKWRPIYFFKQLLKIHIDISSVSYEINFYEALFFYYHVDNTIFANGNGAEAGKLVNEFLSVKRMIYQSFNAMFHAGFYRWREFFNRISCFRQIYKSELFHSCQTSSWV